MAKLLRLRRGTDTQHTTFTGAEGEVTVNTTNDSLHVHDGTTAGGRELARADLSNLPAGTIDNADISSSAAIANSKLATSGVTAGTYGSSSAIPAITVNDRGIVTSATTSAIDSTSIANGTSNVSVANGGDITVTQAGNEKLRADGNGIVVTGRADISGDLTMGGELNIDGGTDANKYLDVRVGSAAFTIRGTSGGDAGHETLAQFERNAGASLFYDNVQKLITTSGGINVTGQMVSDGIVSDGGVTFTNSAGPQLVLKDNDNSGTGAQTSLAFHDSANGSLGIIGYHYNNNNDLEIKNQMNGPIWFGANNTNRVYLDAAGHFIPGVNNSYDLGTSSLRWRNVYTNDLNLSNEGGSNDVDGTWGSWTIQEGEDDLFLLNRRNGKKYKFNLSEVN